MRRPTARNYKPQTGKPKPRVIGGVSISGTFCCTSFFRAAWAGFRPATKHQSLEFPNWHVSFQSRGISRVRIQAASEHHLSVHAVLLLWHPSINLNPGVKSARCSLFVGVYKAGRASLGTHPLYKLRTRPRTRHPGFLGSHSPSWEQPVRSGLRRADKFAGKVA